MQTRVFGKAHEGGDSRDAKQVAQLLQHRTRRALFLCRFDVSIEIVLDDGEHPVGVIHTMMYGACASMLVTVLLTEGAPKPKLSLSVRPATGLLLQHRECSLLWTQQQR